ncbi:hypothetical protein F8388_011145, partial [Cannabis sativa]
CYEIDERLQEKNEITMTAVQLELSIHTTCSTPSPTLPSAPPSSATFSETPPASPSPTLSSITRLSSLLSGGDDDGKGKDNQEELLPTSSYVVEQENVSNDDDTNDNHIHECSPDIIVLPDEEENTIRVNQMFQDKRTLVNTMSMYSIRNNHQHRVKRSSSEDYVLVCLHHDCPWYFRASKCRKTEMYKVRKFNKARTCLSNNVVVGSHRQATIGYENWTRVFINNTRYSTMTSNIVEFIDASIEEVQELTIATLLECLRCLVQNWYSENKNKSLSTHTHLAKKAEDVLCYKREKSLKMKVIHLFGIFRNKSKEQ